MCNRSIVSNLEQVANLLYAQYPTYSGKENMLRAIYLLRLTIASGANSEHKHSKI